MPRLIAFDVETPNSFNHRMSSIGIAVIEDGQITETFNSLVNPQTHFDPFNVSLTGIRPSMVRDAPTFPQLWAQIEPLMLSGILLAHNAPFDLRVLSICLTDYGIEAPRYLPFACTVQMGRRCYPELENHRLDTLCREIGIPLDHHRADSDSYACASLLIDYLSHGLSLPESLRAYDRIERKTLRSKKILQSILPESPPLRKPALEPVACGAFPGQGAQPN
jgi:DNA polymerase III epsilon subunit-like protein